MPNGAKALLFSFGVTTVLVLAAYALSRNDCRRFGEETGLTVKHHLISGCYVKMESGYWIPEPNVFYSPNTPEGVIENAN